MCESGYSLQARSLPDSFFSSLVSSLFATKHQTNLVSLYPVAYQKTFPLQQPWQKAKLSRFQLQIMECRHGSRSGTQHFPLSPLCFLFSCQFFLRIERFLCVMQNESLHDLALETGVWKLQGSWQFVNEAISGFTFRSNLVTKQLVLHGKHTNFRIIVLPFYRSKST